MVMIGRDPMHRILFIHDSGCVPINPIQHLKFLLPLDRGQRVQHPNPHILEIQTPVVLDPGGLGSAPGNERRDMQRAEHRYPIIAQLLRIDSVSAQ
jgi:hypothetical protein